MRHRVAITVIYKEYNDYKKTLECNKIASAYKDSVFNITSQEKVLELQTKYETEKKEAEIIRLTKENQIRLLEAEKQKTHIKYILAIAIITIILGIILFNYYRLKQKNYQHELEKKNLNIEKRLLMAQMNPHFIYNLLNSIQSFISGNNSYMAEKYLSKFAKLIRYNLENTRNTFINLNDEINSLQINLELEKLRFDDKFDFEIKTSPNINLINTQIPPMLVQPFVENAIIHGILNKKDKGHISVNFSSEKKSLLCTIEDDGVGREKSAEINSQKKSKHKSLGMQLVHDRIELLTDQKKSDISVGIIDLKDEAGNAKGTRIILKIPLIQDI